VRGYDYSQAGMYFVTVLTNRRAIAFLHHTDINMPFGIIIGGEMILNEYGKIVENCLLEIPQHFSNAILHEYVVMPNHVHAIIELTGDTTGG